MNMLFAWNYFWLCNVSDVRMNSKNNIYETSGGLAVPSSIKLMFFILKSLSKSGLAFSFCAEGPRKLLTDVFISSFSFFFFLFSSILVECKETNQFAVIQCRGLFDCTGVHSSLYTVDCTHVLQQPGMNIFSYVLVQG